MSLRDKNYLNNPIKGYSATENIAKESTKKTLEIFSRAAEQIPAYKDFLKRNKINSKKVKTIADFKNVPPTSKENYIFRYELKDRCWNSKINMAHTIAASSGSTGEPVFWPRQIEQEIDGARVHELLLSKIFDIKKKRTLFVNSFGLGNWIAGIYTEFCLYLLRLNGIPFTLASPGYNEEETFKVIKNFSKYYDQTIIACHPPVLKIMIENGIKIGIRWKDLNIRFLGAGEGFSENWRDYLLSLVGTKDYLKTMINIYGSADAGLMGFETPFSIALHRITSTDHNFNTKLFKSNRNPYLYQFDPRFKYLETNSTNEILITAEATAPLLRYNIHDVGAVLNYDDALKETLDGNKDFLDILLRNNINKNDWKFPLVSIFGRDKFMTTLYGVNIYPENIKAVLEHARLQKYLTGRFVTEKLADKKQDQYLLLRVELRQTKKVPQLLKNELETFFVSTLKKLNSEYNQVEDKLKQKMHPKISFLKFQDPEFFPEGKIKKMA